MLVSIILAGGSGKRLWPISTENMPKQFINILDNKSLFQHSIENSIKLKVSSVIILCNKNNYDIIHAQIKDYPNQDFHILVEEQIYDTSIAISYACLYIRKKFTNPYILILPTDHYIRNIDILGDEIKELLEIEINHINIFGIKPLSGEKSYGYIKKDSKYKLKNNLYKVKRFVEKPHSKRATAYFKSGNYLWNIGIIFTKCETILSEIEKYENSVIEYATKLANLSHFDDVKIPEEIKISIDYILLEKTNNLYISEINLDWYDLGSWQMLGKLKNRKDNFISGQIYVEDCKESFLYSENKKILAIGVENIIFIETNDSILIASKSNIENISKYREFQYENIYDDAEKLNIRPWGNYEVLRCKSNWQIKILKVQKNHKTSLQSHKYRKECWTVINGSALLTLENRKIFLSKGDQVTILPYIKHRVENIGQEILEILEFQIGEYIDENDIIRWEDEYGRADTSMIL